MCEACKDYIGKCPYCHSKTETIVERYERLLPKMLPGLVRAARAVQKRRAAEIRRMTEER